MYLCCVHCVRACACVYGDGVLIPLGSAVLRIMRRAQSFVNEAGQ